MHPTAASIYNRYNETLRQLVSEIEGRNESFEEPLLNDVSSMFDAIALSTNPSDANKQCMMMEAAASYLDLGISHAYQYLIKSLDEKKNAFEQKCNLSNLDMLDGGKFVGEYSVYKRKAKTSVRAGRQKDDITALPDYEAAYRAYTRIEEMIDRELPFQIIQHAKRNSIICTCAGWIISLVISVAIGKLVTIYSEEIINLLPTWNSV